MCKVLGVSTSGYYLWEKRQDQEESQKEQWNRKLDERIKFHFYDNLTAFGSPRIHDKLVNQDNISGFSENSG
jgi:putative transposase